MTEVWLRSNSRIIAAGLILPAAIMGAGALVLLVAGGTFASNWVGWGLIAAGAALGAVLIWQLRLPRLAYDGKSLLVFARSESPVRVPIEFVECFFVGSGLQQVPGFRRREAQLANLAIRIAERAAEWQQQDVKPALGKWCGGYITLYGAWCEPVTIELAKRLNARLAEVQRRPSLAPSQAGSGE